MYGYLYEHRNPKAQRTDLHEIWPRKGCKWCNGTGILGYQIVKPKKHEKKGPRVTILCDCLEKAEEKLKRNLK